MGPATSSAPSAAGAGNVISGNSWYGVYLWGPNATGNVVQNNIIGLDATATTPVGNGADDPVVRAGVYLSSTVGNRIGGDAAGEGNTIAGNDAKGVIVTGAAADGNAVIGNSITANAGIGIDLGTDGVTLNDPGDADTGPNGLLNFPEIARVQRVAGNLLVDYTLDVPAGDYRVEVFANTAADPTGHGEGETLLGATTVTHTGSGAETFTVSVPSAATILTLTATVDLGGGSYGATSELSAAVPSPDLVVVNATGDAPDTIVGDGQCDTGALNAAGDPECTLRAAIAEANDPATPVDTIWFAIPTADPGHLGGVWTIEPATELPRISATVTIDGSTQSGFGGDPVVALDGTSIVGAATGLYVEVGADDTDLGHLAVVRFPDDGLQVDADRVRVHDLFVGVLPDGVTAAGNATEGIVVAGTDVEVRDNLIGDHGNTAIGLVGTSSGTVVAGNTIGTDAGGTVDLGNLQGVWADTTGDAIVGGTDPADANVIANSGGPGIELWGTAATITVLGNEIRANGGLGIDLDTSTSPGVTLNDPGDARHRRQRPAQLPRAGVGRRDRRRHHRRLQPRRARRRLPHRVLRQPCRRRPHRLRRGRQPHRRDDDHPPRHRQRRIQPRRRRRRRDRHHRHRHRSPRRRRLRTHLGVLRRRHRHRRHRRPTPRRIDTTHRPRTRRRRRSHPCTRPAPAPPSPSPAAPTASTGPAFDLNSSELTMAAWVNRTAAGTDPRLISRADTTGTPIVELYLDSATNEAVATIRLGGVTVEARGGTIGTSTWHHTAATWDGTDLVLYVDGAEVDRVAATGTLDRDLTGPVLVGNRVTGDRGLTGTIDHVVVEHRAATADEIATHVANVDDPATFMALGGEQTGLVAPWTITGTQTRSGGFALAAPEVSGPGATAWATATGLDEPGMVLTSWWWTTSTTLAISAGTRTGTVPTDQYETASSPTGWNLARRTGPTVVQDAAPAGTPDTGRWVQVEMWTDQQGNSRVLVDGIEVHGWTPQGATLASGSVGLRAASVPTGEAWYIDDARGRRLVTPEPVTTLGPLDRD